MNLHEQRLIELDDVSVIENGAAPVLPTTLDIYGGLTALLGPNGAGKTTLASVIHGLRRPTTGRVRHSGIGEGEVFYNRPEPRTKGLQRIAGGISSALVLETAAERRAAAHRSRYLGFIAQSPFLNPALTAAQNIDLPQLVRRNRIDHEWRGHLIDLFDIGKHLGKYTSELSGGEAQRVAIAVALAHKPEFVFADEPTAALDSEHSQSALAAFKTITDSGRIAILCVTHDENITEYANHVITMVDGAVQAA